MNTQTLVNVVRQIQASDKRWIPEEFRGPSYFSITDEWLYNTSEGPNVCEECTSYDNESFYGSDLRLEFPYLQVDDENTIYPSIHPNCMCRLVRATFVGENPP